MRKKLFVLCVAALMAALVLTACTVEVTLDFVVDGEVYASVETTGKEAIQMPQDPAKEGYIFDGWYWDKDVWEQPFTVNSLLEMPLSSNMTVYAKWEEEPHVHTYGEWTVVTPATCTEEGLKKRVCSCGAEETAAIPKLQHTYETKYNATNHWEECSVCQDKINITAHTFGDWTVVTQATCTAEGQKKHTCTVCRLEETAVITVVAHTYETKYDATNHWDECSVCHETVNVTAHTFGEWIAVTPATCTTEGLQKHVCACGAEETESIQKVAHTYITKFDATNHWQECSVGHEKINVTAHTFGEWTVVTSATCTAAGEKKHVCTVCNAEGTAAIPKSEHTYVTKHDATNHWEECSVCQDKINITAHSFGEWIAVTPATCTTEGLQKHVCSCGAEETEAIQKLEHSYGEWTVVTQATCTAEGEKKHGCTVCNAEQTAVIPKLAHSYGEWTVVTQATCAAEGQKKHVCTVCNAEETAVIEKLPHSNTMKYDDTNHWSECSVCGETSNPEAHTYVNDVCTVCNRVYGTQGLAYTRKTNGYSVSGIGSAGSNAKIEIPSLYEGEPVTEIGSNAFENCGFTAIAIPNSVTGIGDYAFYYCSNLTGITIPNSVTSIGESAFGGCGSLTSIIIPNGVTSIGYYAFDGCGSLTIYAEVAAKPSGWESIGCPVVWDYKNNDVADDGYIYTIQNGIRYGIKDGAAMVAGQPSYITEANIASEIIYKDTRYSVTSIGNSAFGGCSSLTSIIIPDSVTSIGNSAFDGCSSLTSIIIPDSVTSIGEYAFYGCSGLTSIAIPIGVTSIGESAFGGCSSLTIYAEAAAEPRGWNSNWNSSNCPVVWDYKNNDVADDGYIYTIQNGIRYGIKDGAAVVVRQPRNITEANIASEIIYKDTRYIVTSIGNSAFDGCSSLTSIAIPDSVTSIGTYAFSGCISLTSITIPDSVTSIGIYAFYGCSSLTSIVIGNRVTSIGNYAFYGCSSLQSIAIPNGVTSIGNYAFRGCSSLTSIAIPQSVTSIGNNAFQSCTGLQSIVIPNSITSIGNYAFQACSSLQSITIPNGVTSIGYHTFYNCSSLTSIAIPNSVTSIGSSAFYNCSRLTSIEYQGTKAEWNAITKESDWMYNTGNYTVTCTDGTLTKSEA